MPLLLFCLSQQTSPAVLLSGLSLQWVPVHLVPFHELLKHSSSYFRLLLQLLALNLHDKVLVKAE